MDEVPVIIYNALFLHVRFHRSGRVLIEQPRLPHDREFEPLRGLQNRRRRPTNFRHYIPYWVVNDDDGESTVPAEIRPFC